MAAVDLRYARALEDVVRAQGMRREDVKAQLADFRSAFDESPQLREVLANPAIPEEQKLRLLDALGARLGMSRTVRNFIATVMHHMRLHELGDMVAAYLELADRESGITDADVTTARPLDTATKRELEQSILRLTGGSSVRATYREDPALLGGAVIKVGSTVYDGSVRGQLQEIKERMIAAAI